MREGKLNWMLRREGSKIKKDRICGRENSVGTYFSGFLFQTLASGKSGSVTLGNAEAYLKTEFKSVGSKSGWGSSATLVIFCRWPKYIWKNENGKTKSKWWISEWSVSNGQITGVYLGKSAWQVKLGLPSLRLKECSEFVSLLINMPWVSLLSEAGMAGKIWQTSCRILDCKSSNLFGWGKLQLSCA